MSGLHLVGGEDEKPKEEAKVPKHLPLTLTICNPGAHKFVNLSSLTKTSAVMTGDGGQKVEGISFVFFCERCLSIEIRGMKLGAGS